MTDVLTLPSVQLRLLVAFAACWRVCNRAPTEYELRRARVLNGQSKDAKHALIRAGLLVCARTGKRAWRASLRPSFDAWEQIRSLEGCAEAAQ